MHCEEKKCQVFHALHVLVQWAKNVTKRRISKSSEPIIH
jgi:hypothetical protein